MNELMNELIQITDEALLAQAAGGDESAFETLVKRYESKIINLAYKYARNADEAEDIAAETFFRVWEHAADFKGQSKFSTWCYRIAVNICLNYKQALKRNPVFEYIDRIFENDGGEFKKEIAEPAQGSQPDVVAHAAEHESFVTAAIDALPPQQKTAFVLSWFEGHSYQEIAAIMELSIPSVESLLFRAKENLRKKIKPN
jgi:RNA polymerase sigma-70 factor (ECF subfamily)